MHHDPRKPDPRYMVSSGSTNPVHGDMRKTLVLLMIEGKETPIYFVIEGLSQWPQPLDEMISHARYLYEEHTCPTNFIRIPLIASGGDLDPHGVFEFVDAVWMMDEYDPDDADEYLTEVFPQLTGGPVLDLKANTPKQIV